jgi:hypothetical protein
MMLPARTLVGYAGLAAALMVIANCNGGGGGGSTGPSANAPTISNLRVVPLNAERANTQVNYSATVDFVDAQGDVFNGTCEISSDVLGTASVPIGILLPGADPNQTEGFVLCRFFVRVPAPTQLSMRITLIDRAGNRSNSLSFVLGISEILRGQAPSDSEPASGLRPGSATLGRR